jgi:DNA-binding CsgD family transcriptional regulator/tetratricopeptide (TPR) repeat protein
MTLRNPGGPALRRGTEGATHRAGSGATVTAVASGGAPVRSRFVGREAEIAELGSELARTRDGDLRCVVLEGEPGIGKTRLASEAAATEGQGAITLSARGYPLGAASSFGLWAEAFDGYLRDQPPATVAEICGDALDDLAAVLRSARAAGGRCEDDPSAVRLREALAVLLRNLARRRPVVVLLDDLHLADTSSWEALDYLAHNLREARVLVLGCVRPGELGGLSVAKQVVFRLEQEGILRRLGLDPLGPDELGTLAAVVLDRPAVPPTLVRWLTERSGGNPLFAVGLLDALARSPDDDLDLTGPSLDAIPKALGERLAARLGLLDPEATAVLDVLAVVGHRIDRSELARLLPPRPEQLDAVVVGLVDARLVAEHEHGARVDYEIAHPLMQEVIYERLGVTRRRALHRSIGRALWDADRLGEAASHLSRAADVGDDEAIGALGTVAHQAWSRNAFGDAFHVVSNLLRLIPPGDERSLAALDLLVPGGEWLFYEHKEDLDMALGVRIMREMQRILGDSADPARLGALNLYLCVFLGWGNGDRDEAIRRGHEAVEQFRQAGDHALARLAAHEVTWIYGVDGDHAAQEREARKVVEEAEAAGDGSATVLGLISLTHALWPRGEFAAAERDFGRAVELASGHESRTGLVHCHAFRAMVLAFEGRLASAQTALAAAAVADEDDREPLVTEVGLLLSYLAGDVGTARDRARQAAIGMGPGQSWVMLVGALAAVESGDAGEAAGYLAALAEVMDDRRYWMINLPYAWASALHRWGQGDVEAAAEGLDGVARDLLAIDAVAIAPSVLVDLAEVAAQVGWTERVVEAAAQLGDIARRVDRDHHCALADMGGGWAALGRGCHEDAVGRADRAATRFAKSGHRLHEARCLDLAARAVAAVEPQEATPLFRAAMSGFTSCSAGWRRSRSADALAALGRPGHRALAALDGPRPLTVRERQVAELAVDGLTAREIGERLFIGVRTVETHLANIYAKVGVRSRVELLRRAAELSR